MGERWRTGRKVGRTVYIHGEGDEVGRLVGLMDTPELAERVCEAVNARASVDQARDIARELLAALPVRYLPTDLWRRLGSDPALFWLRGEEAEPTSPEEGP